MKKTSALARPPKESVRPIDLDLLAKLPSLELRARYLVEGGLLGQHRSPLKGYNAEFVEYRSYYPGDDLRRVDWRLFARSDRLCVKRFEEETQLRVCLLLDVSKSMRYGSESSYFTKLDFARTVLAALVRLVHDQQDAVGIAFLSDQLTDYFPPRSTSRHSRAVMERLDSPALGNETQLAQGLSELAEVLRRRAMIVIASDFYEDAVLLEPVLRRLRYDGHEVIGFHVLDPIEVDFEKGADGIYVDMESRESQPVSMEMVRKAYQKEFRAFQLGLSDLFGSIGGDFTLLRTDASPIEALSSYLVARARFL